MSTYPYRQSGTAGLSGAHGLSGIRGLSGGAGQADGRGNHRDGATMRCSSCSGTMELDDAVAGDEFECPHCSAIVAYEPIAAPARETMEAKPVRAASVAAHDDVREAIAARQEDLAAGDIVGRRGLVSEPPARLRVTPKTDRAVAKGYPPVDAPETDIMRVHPSMARTQPFLYVGLVLLTALGLLGTAWMMVRGRPLWVMSVPGVLGCAGGVWLLVWWLQTRGSEIRVTTKRLIDTDGLWTRRVTEVLHRDIKRIELKQTLWERMCGVGQLAISADTDDGPEVFMAHVPQPQKLREIIDLYRPL